MPLDSDVANGDSQLHVEFYENKSEPDRPRTFVRIMIPGDKTNIIDQPVREDHKRRFPRQFQHFLMQSVSPDVIGTPLDTWRREAPEEITDGQLAELQILKFQTVEQLAQASDSQLQKIGMGAAGLRERARGYIGRRNSSENKSEIEELKAQIAEMRAMFTKPEAPQATQDEPHVPAAAVVAEKRGPGRPPKVQ